MRATNIEFRHQTLLQRIMVAVCFLTYLINREDIVWHFVKNSAAPHELERWLFAVATLLIAVGVGLRSWVLAYRGADSSADVRPYRSFPPPRYLGDLFYAVGLGSLAPLPGFVILVVGEGLRIFRLLQRKDDNAQSFQAQPSSSTSPLARPIAGELDPGWGKALRQEAGKWGLVVTMIVFVITLKDRVAEVLAVTSLLVGLLLNALYAAVRRASHSGP